MATPLLRHYQHLFGARDSKPDRTVVVLILDQEGRLVRWNRAAEIFTGYSKTEIVGHVFWDVLLFREDAEPLKRHFKRMISGAPSEILEYRWKLRDGAVRWVACSNFDLCISPGGTQYLLFTATDVTGERGFGLRATLFERFQRAGEAERYEISRFIHDTFAQNLVALTFSLEQAQRESPVHDLGLALDLVERCCRDTRLLMYLLTPPALGPDRGFVEGMEHHARTLREAGALDIDFRALVTPDILFPNVREVLFAAVHEFTARAVTNRRMKKRVCIVLKREGSFVLLEIAGEFGATNAGDRECLAIRERVGALGGHLEMAPGSVRIAIPSALANAA